MSGVSSSEYLIETEIEPEFTLSELCQMIPEYDGDSISINSCDGTQQ